MKNKEILNINVKIDPVIKKILALNISPNLEQIMNYQISAGGKRVRPIFLFASCLLLNGKLKDALNPAAGLEILHNYSLIVDDIIDNSEIRRNKPTVWKKYGKDIAQCIGIAYSASIFQAALLSKNPEKVSDVFARAIKEIVEGEILDILYERAGRENEPYVTQKRWKQITEKDYLKMIGKKTASLCATSCELGAISANGTEKQKSYLRNYGYNVGIAFQIIDDLLDVFGKEKNFGKKIGKDIEERKGGNIVILLALKELSSEKRKKLSLILEKKRITQKDIREAIKMIKETEAQKKTLLMAEKYAKKAKGYLKFLPNNKWNQALVLFADFMVSRNK
jgi:geranylgeranyl diphosphate synthase, type I